MNLNVSPSHLPIEQIQDDHDQAHLHPFGLNHRIASSSSSSVLCRVFFNSTQDHTDYYHHKLRQPQLHQEDDNYAYNQGGSTSYEIKNKVETSGLKLTLWKKETDHHHGVVEKDNIQGKWMSSKMNYPADRVAIKITTKVNDHGQNKLQSSSSLGSDVSSNSSINNNSPVRVCADCKTTKTPLWRSGPQGPKSLCNACGIRQRKARRAMAASTTGNSAAIASDQAPAMKIKVPHKEKHARNNDSHDLPIKKRCKMGVGSQNKRLGLEDFLINLSKSITFHRVFPEDEKDAAILLMALSSGLVHG